MESLARGQGGTSGEWKPKGLPLILKVRDDQLAPRKECPSRRPRPVQRSRGFETSLRRPQETFNKEGTWRWGVETVAGDRWERRLVTWAGAKVEINLGVRCGARLRFGLG